VRFPFDRRRGLIVVKADIAGPKGSGVALLALDTGATFSMLSPQFLLTLGCEINTRDRRQIVTASGTETASRLIIRRLRALGRERSAFPVLCYDLPAGLQVDGLLGLDFMIPYRLVVDFPNATVVLR
jgi:predicted aspartyl protease